MLLHNGNIRLGIMHLKLYEYDECTSVPGKKEEPFEINGTCTGTWHIDKTKGEFISIAPETIQKVISIKYTEM